MAKPSKWKMDKLERREAVALQDAQERIKAARQQVAIIVHGAARQRGLLVSGRNREALYKKIGDTYLQLDNGLKDWSKDLVQKGAADWHDAAIKDIKGQTGIDPSNEVTRFSREYAEDVFKRVHPENGKSLASVLTEKMATNDIKSLRQAVTDVYREGALSGMSMTDMAANIKDRWDSLAGNMADNRFMDAAGRTWDDGRYLQMLVRTTTARVARDSYFDTLVKNGDDLAIVQNADGEACDICNAWDGVIISITGASEKYPSYNNALDAGCFHPNCRCMAERVDETIDKDSIKAQGNTPTPDFTRQANETDADYRNRMTDRVSDYSQNFPASETDQSSIIEPPIKTVQMTETEIIRDKIANAVYTKSESLGGGINLSVKLTNGQKVVFKPKEGEYKAAIRQGISPGTQYLREKAASIIDEALGFGLVPPTEIITNNGAIGSAQLFKEGFLTGDALNHQGIMMTVFDKIPKAVREKWFTFDTLMNNSDRHIGNFMMLPSVKKVELALIDNGLCLSTETLASRIPSKLSKQFSGKPISKGVIDKLKALSDNRGVVKDKLSPLLEPKALKLFFDRLDVMLAAGIHQ